MDIMTSDERREKRIGRMRETIRKKLTHPELPVLHIGVAGDSEGRTSCSPGWMNGNIEDILRKVYPISGRAMGVREISVSVYTMDQIAKIWWEYNVLENVEYIPLQEMIRKEVSVYIALDKVEEFIKLLNSETRYSIHRRTLNFSAVLVEI